MRGSVRRPPIRWASSSPGSTPGHRSTTGSAALRLALTARARSERGAVRADDVGVVSPARLDRAPLRLVVDVDEAEALREAVGPLEVVEQRPGEVAAHVRAPGDRLA